MHLQLCAFGGFQSRPCDFNQIKMQELLHEDQEYLAVFV